MFEFANYKNNALFRVRLFIILECPICKDEKMRTRGQMRNIVEL